MLHGTHRCFFLRPAAGAERPFQLGENSLLADLQLGGELARIYVPLNRAVHLCKHAYGGGEKADLAVRDGNVKLFPFPQQAVFHVVSRSFKEVA